MSCVRIAQAGQPPVIGRMVFDIERCKVAWLRECKVDLGEGERRRSRSGRSLMRWAVASMTSAYLGDPATIRVLPRVSKSTYPCAAAPHLTEGASHSERGSWIRSQQQPRAPAPCCCILPQTARILHVVCGCAAGRCRDLENCLHACSQYRHQGGSPCLLSFLRRYSISTAPDRALHALN